MTCDELRPDYTLYALGIADDQQRAEIAEHLVRRCANCVPGVTSALATVTAMSGTVRLTEPPKRLRRRVMAAVERAPRRSRAGLFAPWAITAALSIALVAIGVSGRRQAGDTPRLQQALAILNDPATRDATFGVTEKSSGETEKSPKGRVFLNPGEGIVFIGAGLPRIDAGRTFELWVIPVKGNAVPAGLFASRPGGTALFVRPGSVDHAAAIAVTVEPEGGSGQPTAAPIIVTKF